MGILNTLGLSLSRTAQRTYDGITSTLAATLRNRNPPAAPVARRLGSGGDNSQYQPYDAEIDATRKKPNLAIINDWIVPSTLGWTLEALQNAVLGLENGNLYAAHSLMLAMTRDATVGHGLRTYNLSLSALDWEIVWPRSIPEVARKSLMDRWPDSVTPQDLATSSSYQVMLGLAPATQAWSEEYEVTGEKFWQFKMEVLESGHLQYRTDLRRYYFIARDGYREICDDGNAWTLFKSLGDRRHHLDSAVRTLATLWFIVQEAVRYHRAYNAEYGRPIKGLMVPDQMRLTEDVAGLVEQASGLYGGSVIILPQFDEGSGQANFDLKLIEAKSRGYATFLELAEVARKLITLYLVGVLDTTQSGAGSHGKASAQEKVAERYLMAGARVREDALNRVLRRWAEFNAFDEAPRYVIKTTPPEDAAHAAEVAGKRAAALKSTMEALSKMKDMGVTITEEKVERWASRVAGVDLKQRAIGQALAPTIHEGSAEAVERATDTVMVCWEPPSVVARALAVPGGEPWDELHITLALCPAGSVTDVIAAVVAWSGGAGPVEGFLTGSACWPTGGARDKDDAGSVVKLPVREPKPQAVGHVEGGPGQARVDGEDASKGKSDKAAKGVKQALTWLGLTAKRSAMAQETANEDDAGEDETFDDTAPSKHGPPRDAEAEGQLAYVTLADVPELADLRSKLVSALEASGIDVKQDHGFIPHMTRAYLPAGSRVDAPGAPVPIDIDTVSVWAVGGRLRVPIRLSGAAGEVGDMPPPPNEPVEVEDDGEPTEDEQEAQPEPNPVADNEDDTALDDDIDELEGQINALTYELSQYELRIYQRARNGQFGSGGGIGSAAYGHSATAKEASTVGAHRQAARAHAAVARRFLQKGDKEKAAEHLAIAKGHRDDANKLKVAAKAGAKKGEPAKEAPKAVEHAPKTKVEAPKAEPSKAEQGDKLIAKTQPKVEGVPAHTEAKAAPAKLTAGTISEKHGQEILAAYINAEVKKGNDTQSIKEINDNISKLLGKEHGIHTLFNAYTAAGITPLIHSISTDKNKVSMRLTLHDAKGKQIGHTARSISKEKGQLIADQKELFLGGIGKAKGTGEGTGSKIIANNYAAYEKLGVKKAYVHAAYVGSYVWAKMGYTASAHDLAGLNQDFKKLLDKKGVKAPDFKSVHDMAKYEHNGEKLGKEFLLHVGKTGHSSNSGTGQLGWTGHVNINHSDPGYKTMQAYLGRVR